MLYKGGMCLGSVVTYSMYVPKAVPHAAGCQRLKSGFNLVLSGGTRRAVSRCPPYGHVQ
jgi:hypothetical protein